MGIDGSGVWDRGFGSNDKAATYHRFQCSQLANALSAVFAAPLRPFPPPFRSLLLYFSLDLNIQVFPFAPPLPASLLSYPCFLTACIFGFYLYSDPRNLLATCPTYQSPCASNYPWSVHYVPSVNTKAKIHHCISLATPSLHDH
jgi:hypothetical protein